MIVKGQFNETSMKRSQHSYILHALLHGVLCTCLGETIIILPALHQNALDFLVGSISLLFMHERSTNSISLLPSSWHRHSSSNNSYHFPFERPPVSPLETLHTLTSVV